MEGLTDKAEIKRVRIAVMSVRTLLFSVFCLWAVIFIFVLYLQTKLI